MTQIAENASRGHGLSGTLLCGHHIMERCECPTTTVEQLVRTVLEHDRAPIRRAAERVRHELERADDGNYLRDAWYAYMSRRDVTLLLEHAERTT